MAGGAALLAAALADAARAETGPVPTAPRRVPPSPGVGGWRNLPSQPQVEAYLPSRTVPSTRCATGWGRAGLAAAPGTHPGVRVAVGHPCLGAVSKWAVCGGRSTSPPTATVTVYSSYSSVRTRFTALPRFPEPEAPAEPGSLLAPMPGTVVRIVEGLRRATGSPPGSRCCGWRR